MLTLALGRVEGGSGGTGKEERKKERREGEGGRNGYDKTPQRKAL